MYHQRGCTFWLPDQMEDLGQVFLKQTANKHKDKIEPWWAGDISSLHILAALSSFKSEHLTDSWVTLLKTASFNKGSNEGNWFNDFILKFKQKAGTEWWCRSDKKSSDHANERQFWALSYKLLHRSWILWRSLMIVLGERKI